MNIKLILRQEQRGERTRSTLQRTDTGDFLVIGNLAIPETAKTIMFDADRNVALSTMDILPPLSGMRIRRGSVAYVNAEIVREVS